MATNRTPILRTTLNKAPVYSTPINAMQKGIIWCEAYHGWPINGSFCEKPANSGGNTVSLAAFAPHPVRAMVDNTADVKNIVFFISVSSKIHLLLSL